MSRSINRLNARFVETAKAPGRHADGGNLYLVVNPGGSRSWVFLYRSSGRLREMGLGSASLVSLARVRELAAGARAQLAEGKDPLAMRRKSRSTQDQTFGASAQHYYTAKSGGWSNEKVRSQWLPMMERYCGLIWQKPVSDITVQDVVEILTSIWFEKAETASRVRGRVEAVLDSARVRGLMPEERANVARWRGNLSHLLPKLVRLQRGHFPAMPFLELPDFMKRLRAGNSVSSKCLEFTILTAARTSEAIGARWGEVDLAQRLWILPPRDPVTGRRRMKMGREHRVPLSDRAFEVLLSLDQLRQSSHDFIFPSQRPGYQLSTMAMEAVLRRMKAKPYTVHGFRSTFRDWAGDCTDFPREIVEMALAHAVGNAVERAYRRGDALEKRRELMQQWEKYTTLNTSQSSWLGLPTGK